MADHIPSSMDRRTVLSGLAGLGTTALAGCGAFSPSADSGSDEMTAERARDLAERFAPTLYFDRNEPWFPTDPRPYTSETDDGTVVDGFDALDGYHDRYGDGSPPDPTVFYHGIEYGDSPLAVIQFWFYSVFDQFSANFHWHDWEVFHAFVDTETDEPVLYVASSHSRRVPNNEFLDPDPDVVPRILSELGSHSSALSVNDVPDQFQRLSIDDLLADITNSAIEGIEDLANVPLAYGLPRDEEWRLPYAVPEYEGVPLYDHDALPSVDRDSFVDPSLTIRSFDALDSPPTSLPTRETGLTFEFSGRDGTSDVEYALVPTTELEDIDDFTGPQLSFEFSVPSVVEDAMASHITSAGVPWDQPRYENPAADISDAGHRLALADAYAAIGEPGTVDTVVTRITEAVTTDEAPEDQGLTTTETDVEAVALIESEPELVPTFGGVAVAQGLPAGDHRVTVNGAGRAPHSESVTVTEDDGPTVAGVAGEIPLVARGHARKLEVVSDEDGIDLDAVAVEDDFAGRLYESPVSETDAVYVHESGAYTTEVSDRDGEKGAYRINPDPGATGRIRIERPETGKASLASFVTDIADETRAMVARQADELDESTTGSANAVRGLQRALENVVEAAAKATDDARSGDRSAANSELEVVARRLQTVADRLDAARSDLPSQVSNAVGNRMNQADRRTDQARNAESLGTTGGN
ncbi:MAG: hypothetical protein ACOCSF_02920 [Halanaeroarchaeum sp.]